MDFDKSRMLAPKAMIEGGTAGHYRQSGHPVVPLVDQDARFHIAAKVAGKDVHFLCDTGANGTTLRADFAKSISAEITEREGTISTLRSRATSRRSPPSRRRSLAWRRCLTCPSMCSRMVDP